MFAHRRLFGLTSLVSMAVAASVLFFNAPAVNAADPIKIGFGMALTGPLAANGKMSLVAMQVWEDDINAQGGLLGRPVKLIHYTIRAIRRKYLQSIPSCLTSTKST